MSIKSLKKSEVLGIYSMHSCTPTYVLRVGYLIVGIMEDVPPRNTSPLHGLLPVLKNPMIELQMVDIVQAVDGLHFDMFVITLSKG